MKKKLLFTSLTFSILTPIITFSCTNSSEPGTSKTPVIEVISNIELTEQEKQNFAATNENNIPRSVKVSKNIADNMQDLVKSRDFVPPTAKQNLNKLAPAGTRLNKGFFDNVPQKNKLHNSIAWIRITTKDEFDQLVINRFKELNNKDGVVTSDAEIKQEFEKNYLNNQDVYAFLQNNDIYVADMGAGLNLTNGFLSNIVVPFDSGDSIVINVFPGTGANEQQAQFENLLQLQTSTWNVFTLPKSKNVTFKILDFMKSEDALTGILEFFPKLFKWYNTEYVNFYKEQAIE